MRCALSVVFVTAIVSVAGAQTWDETGPVFGGHPDADRLPATANVTAGVGPLTQINGWCLNGSDPDLFRITVTNASSFSASVSTTLAGRNLSLALFDANGYGVVANYDSSAGSTDPLISNVPGLTNGTYYLLVYGTVNYPTDALTNFIFVPPASGSGQTGLVFPQAGTLPLSGFLTDFGAGFGGSFAASPYTALLNGAGYAQTPTPGATALLGVAGLGLVRRRR